METARVPVGLTISMVVATASLGAIVIAWNLPLGQPARLETLVHVCAGLCLLWGVVSYALARRRHPWSTAGLDGDTISVLTIAKLTTGLAALIIMLYVAVAEALFRTVFVDYVQPRHVHIWMSGLLDLGLICASTLLGWHRTRENQLVTALFWILVLTGLWTTFLLTPTVRHVLAAGMVRKPELVAWESTLVLWTAGLVTLFTLAREYYGRRWRSMAWPDGLWRLGEPPPHWPGFRYSVGIVGASVLILGLLLLVLPSTSVSALLVGVSALLLAHQRWEENLADVGLGLITLGIISLLMPRMGESAWTPAVFMSVFTRGLLGLALMSWFWYWLAQVWEQQLDRGRAWTTTGRLIRPARRVGYLLASAAVLVSFHISLWPKYPHIDDLDNSPTRWMWGILANAAVILSITWTALFARKTTMAWLAILTLASLTAFMLVRSPHAVLTRLWVMYWPAMLAAAGGVFVVFAYLTRRFVLWHPFHEPLLVGGVLILPMAAIVGITLSEQLLSPREVPVLTFAGLACGYALATVLLRHRRLVILAVLCAILCLGHLR